MSRFGAVRNFVRNAAAYLVSTIVSSFVYLGCTLSWVLVMLHQVPGAPPIHPDGATMASMLVVSAFLWLAGGFGPALLIMVFPWTIAVWAHHRFRWQGRVYFPATGALLVFVIGCAAASVAPKPLFIDDQTFWEGALISAKRQGLILLASGVVFGVSFWSLRERLLP